MSYNAMKNKVFNKSTAIKATIIASPLFVTVAANAADYTADITTASTEGSANVVAVIAAVIGIAILGFGVGSMLGWFKK